MTLLDQGEDQLERDSHQPRKQPPFGRLAVAVAGVLLLASPSLAVPPNLVSELPARSDHGFLISMDRSPTDAIPLAGSGQIAFPADGDTPALVPLAPPVWAGLGLLGALAFARHKSRRRYRTA